MVVVAFCPFCWLRGSEIPRAATVASSAHTPEVSLKRTSPSRCHHLLKTFYCGVGGWREQQLSDGTLILTSPTGHTYTTKPGSAQLFPTLCQPTAELHLPAYQPTRDIDGRGVMMPKRRRTRAENLAKRIHAERKLNDEHVAERNRPPPF